jgi:hypothetical protein
VKLKDEIKQMVDEKHLLMHLKELKLGQRRGLLSLSEDLQISEKYCIFSLIGY